MLNASNKFFDGKWGGGWGCRTILWQFGVGRGRVKVSCDEVGARNAHMLIKQLDFDTFERRSWRAEVARTPETHIFAEDVDDFHRRCGLRIVNTLQNSWKLVKFEGRHPKSSTRPAECADPP